VIMHHAHFDGFILSEIYNVRPRFTFDTLSMARAVNGPLERASLEELARRYGQTPKTVPYNKFRGKRWRDIDPIVRSEICDGALHDVGLTEIVFRELIKGFPKDELEVIDMTVKMYTDPQVLGDADLFKTIAEVENIRKAETLAELGVTASQLQ